MDVGRRREALVSARKAAGLTQEGLADALRVDRSTVIRWEAGDYAPLPFLRPKLAALLGRSRDELREIIEQGGLADKPVLGDELDPALGWLDCRAGWPAGDARRQVQVKLSARPAQGGRRNVGRSRAVEALTGYYADPVPPHANYAVRCGQLDVETSIFTRTEWLDLACPLTAAGDQLTLSAADELPRRGLDRGAAVRRLAEAAEQGVRITDVPIYRLLEADVREGVVGGRVGLAPFVEYALTADLLERELSEILAVRERLQPGAAQLRDRYLPDLASVLDVSRRLCAGGVLALTAVARPADPFRGEADYLLLVQRRSGHVLNAAGQLAVIPKAFHRPLADYRADARIGATLRRELEEELFGRLDVDNTAGGQRVADPMHPSRMSAPMRWLTEEPGRLRMECTGFGFNLVSGNYEFASLVVIEDEEFWPRFGGQVEANWESSGLQQYSTLDGDLIEELVADESWSNEGLFALLQGLRRLGEIGASRVVLPAIDLRACLTW